MQLVVTLVVYSLYAAVLGASLAPVGGALPAAGDTILFALSVGRSLYVFLFWGLILIGSLVRLLSLGIRPGRYPAISPVTLLWVILSGIFTIAFRMILPIVPMTYFSETFYRLCGMRLGRGAWINTVNIMDPYLVEIGEGCVVGLRAYLRKGRTVAPGSRISSLAGLDTRLIRAMEKGGNRAGPRRDRGGPTWPSTDASS